MPMTNPYLHFNPDEMDHILVDPAYRLEKLKELTEKSIAMQMAYIEVDNQLAKYGSYHQIPLNKTVYENWWKIEKSILKYD